MLFTVGDPASLSLGLVAGLDIASARLVPVQAVTAAAGFVLVATATVIVPLFIYLLGGAAAERTLIQAKAWLTANQRTVTMVLFLILGAMMIGRGTGDLAG